ncbi:MAG: aldolase/citrate lyase family protein [Chloroflexi bacterium]|nr:aldolase/citrate lyase family protein [Chloroflexota bacterium]
MKTNHVREKLKAGKQAIGCFLGLGSPSVAELMAHAGFDWLVIETEHNGLDSAEIEHMLRAIDGTDAVPIVRVPSSNPVFIQRALDMGAMGVLVPMVKSAEEARAVVSATRYPPEGTRSWGPLRASGYTFDNDDYFERANENILVALILETKDALDDLETLAGVTGVDAIFLGPWDMSLALGLDPRHLPLPEIDAVLDRMVELSLKTGIAAGAGAGTPEEIRERQAAGVTFLSYGPDYGLLVQAARAGLEAFDRG